ncbi:unnamed protein product [Polarella glacialis]|uniref:Uncharacterized protein n=1 Tax=Polarella glacialis TaxID=89957 RepID=A0A813FM31_POLGL|nr:unnamed protein product [Polarella glacialis]
MLSYFFAGPCCNQEHSSSAVVVEVSSSSEDETPEFWNSSGFAAACVEGDLPSGHPLPSSILKATCSSNNKKHVRFHADQKGWEDDSDEETKKPRGSQTSEDFEAGYHPNPFVLLLERFTRDAVQPMADEEYEELRCSLMSMMTPVDENYEGSRDEDVAPDISADFEPPAFVEVPSYVVQSCKKEGDHVGFMSNMAVLV